MNACRSFIKIANTPACWLMLAGTLFTAVPLIRQSAGRESAAIIWAWGVCLLLKTDKVVVARKKLWDFMTPWLLLPLAWLTARHAPILPACVPLAILFLAGIAFYGDSRLMARCLPATLMLFCLIPHIDTLHLTLSSPLSKISAALTALILNVASFDCQVEGAILILAGRQIAITAACSGVDLLEAMLFLAWLISTGTQRTPKLQTTHFLMVLPLIVGFNSLRLAIASLLSLRIGERAFHEPLHSIFGYGVIFCTALALYGIGQLIQPREDT